jgi:hypothetical protein
MCDERLNIAVVCCRLYHIIMENIAGGRKKSLQFPISAAVKTETDIYELRRIGVHGVGYPGATTRPEFSLECSLPVVRSGIHAASNRRIGSEVLLHGT